MKYLGACYVASIVIILLFSSAQTRSRVLARGTKVYTPKAPCPIATTHTMSDPSLLFTPQKSPPNLKSDAAGPPDSPPVVASSPLRTRSTQASSRRTFYISVPMLSEAEKATYKQFSEDPIPSDDEFSGMPFNSIIGEYQEGSKLLYFVRTSEKAQAFQVCDMKICSSCF